MPVNPITGVWTGQYSPPSPKELPKIRTQLHQQMQDEHTLAIHAGYAAEGLSLLQFDPDPVKNAKIILEQERMRLNGASLYWVSPEMTELASAAADTLPSELRIDEIVAPSRCGFVVFGRPVGSYTGRRFRDTTVTIAAMSWGPVVASEEESSETWITFYSYRDDEWLRANFHRIRSDNPDVQSVDDVTRFIPKWQWDNELLVSNDKRLGDMNRIHEAFTTPYDSTTMPWLKMLCSTWVLMAQPGIAETSEQRPTSKTIRRDKRHGVTTSPVRLVNLRRQPQQKDADDPSAERGREYSVRWHVEPYWRYQRVGEGLRERRWVYIAAQIRGPEGKPLKLKKSTPVKILK